MDGWTDGWTNGWVVGWVQNGVLCEAFSGIFTECVCLPSPALEEVPFPLSALFLLS